VELIRDRRRARLPATRLARVTRAPAAA